MNEFGRNAEGGSTCNGANHEWTPNEHRFLYSISDDVDTESEKIKHELAVEQNEFMQRLTEQLTGMETRMSYESESGFLSIATPRVIENCTPPAITPRFLSLLDIPLVEPRKESLLDIPHVESRKESFDQEMIKGEFKFVPDKPKVCIETRDDVLSENIC